MNIKDVQKMNYLYLMWTLKESYLKAWQEE
ncbi:4-phosphopantetheinyl transferase family protein [Clostridium gasigenes]|nr:4-phosphopantetheinyl transferase family protein [Clostridium gasigenes]